MQVSDKFEGSFLMYVQHHHHEMANNQCATFMRVRNGRVVPYGPAATVLCALIVAYSGVWLDRGANAEFTDGGDVEMSCELCSCVGSAHDGTEILVFANPSSGEQARTKLSNSQALQLFRLY